jgi:hypothetical protein
MCVVVCGCVCAHKDSWSRLCGVSVIDFELFESRAISSEIGALLKLRRSEAHCRPSPSI